MSWSRISLSLLAPASGLTRYSLECGPASEVVAAAAELPSARSPSFLGTSATGASAASFSNCGMTEVYVSAVSE